MFPTIITVSLKGWSSLHFGERKGRRGGLHLQGGLDWWRLYPLWGLLHKITPTEIYHWKCPFRTWSINHLNWFVCLNLRLKQKLVISASKTSFTSQVCTIHPLHMEMLMQPFVHTSTLSELKTSWCSSQFQISVNQTRSSSTSHVHNSHEGFMTGRPAIECSTVKVPQFSRQVHSLPPNDQSTPACEFWSSLHSI